MSEPSYLERETENHPDEPEYLADLRILRRFVGDTSGNFIVHVHRLISSNYFDAPYDFVEKYAYPYQGNVSVSRGNQNHYLGTVSNTSWHREFGNAKGSVIAAVADLGGRARTSEIAI